ncbi:MAG: hypothetical protein Q7K38_01125 [Candidatus Wildermuthbacteria bacterium]|nr:hypothetical protein [Candidatus Wildermuthbacteria bacterium]
MAIKKKKTKTRPKAKKKAVTPKKKTVKVKKPKEKLIGKVEHYYDKIGVMALRLKDVLKKGDTILIEGGDKSFKQKIVSMQIDHEVVTSAKKGSDIGIKVSKKAREGYRVFKVA